MKKQILLLFLFLTCSKVSFSQVFESEKIAWDYLYSKSCNSFTLTSENFVYECKDCRFVELKSNSGVSGYFVLGRSTFSIPANKIHGKSSAMLIRLNPKDSATYLSIQNPTQINDHGFVSLSLLVLNDIFKRSYHSGMDALIPAQGDYTIDIFTDEQGDMLVAYANKKMEIINISNRQKK